MSFSVMRVFEESGFKLKELIIKEQHNCSATGFWKTNSVKHNFLLIAHEYLLYSENNLPTLMVVPINYIYISKPVSRLFFCLSVRFQ